MASKALFAFLVAGGLSMATVAVMAADEKAPAATPATPATTQAVKALGNKMCPVMPEDEVSKKWSVTYKGEKIGLCCKDCVKDFNKEPEKYAKIAREDAAKNKKS